MQAGDFIVQLVLAHLKGDEGGRSVRRGELEVEIVKLLLAKLSDPFKGAIWYSS